MATLTAPPDQPATVADEAAPRGVRRTFAALGERDFAVYFAGNLAFFLAMQMDQLMRGFYAFQMTGTAAALGLIAISSGVPLLFVSAFGGVIADRYSKRKVLLIVQTTIAITNAIFAIMIAAGIVEFWHLLAGSVVQAVLMSVAMPVRNAIVPQLVPRHQLMNAVSLQMGGMNLTRIVGPAIAGVIIAPFGVGVAWWMVVALYALSTATIFRLPSHGMASERTRQRVLTEVKDGFAYILRTPIMRLLLLTALVMPLFAFPVQTIMPVFAEQVFRRDSTGLAILMSASGIGGLTGAVLAASLESVSTKGRLMLAGSVAQGALFIAFALSPQFWPAVVLLALASIGGTLFMTTNNSIIQALVPEEFRGRVMSVMMMSFGIMPLGVVPMALLADRLGASRAVTLTSVTMLCAVAIVFAISPQLRGLRVTPHRRAELSPAQAAALVAEGRISREQADRLSGLDSQA
ncbi:MAG: MFS transporter [Dehalococcoidia bacterium]|nr:MFS transporter [Dehalococcoidia bacterium]